MCVSQVGCSKGGFSEFAGLRSSSSAALPFAKRGYDDFVSVIAFQTSVVSASTLYVYIWHGCVRV